jgi:hypothetical protein
MNYQKPELTPIENPVRVIQHTQKDCGVIDHADELETPNAYEADE